MTHAEVGPGRKWESTRPRAEAGHQEGLGESPNLRQKIFSEVEWLYDNNQTYLTKLQLSPAQLPLRNLLLYSLPPKIDLPISCGALLQDNGWCTTALP